MPETECRPLVETPPGWHVRNARGQLSSALRADDPVARAAALLAEPLCSEVSLLNEAQLRSWVEQNAGYCIVVDGELLYKDGQFVID